MSERIKICQLPIINKNMGFQIFNDFFNEQGSSGFHFSQGFVELYKKKKN